MSLSTVLGNGLSPWEERILAAAYLLEITINPESFEETVGRKLEKAWEDLKSLPPVWARELSIATLILLDAEI